MVHQPPTPFQCLIAQCGRTHCAFHAQRSLICCQYFAFSRTHCFTLLCYIVVSISLSLELIVYHCNSCIPVPTYIDTAWLKLILKKVSINYQMDDRQLAFKSNVTMTTQLQLSIILMSALDSEHEITWNPFCPFYPFILRNVNEYHGKPSLK